MNCPLLQWGRDLSVAECAPLFLKLRQTLQTLQWGRDLSVAEWSIRQRVSAMYRASMGPRPFGRGMTRLEISISCPLRGFNGAATFRSRNVTFGDVKRISAKRFNGAATFRSRNVESHGDGEVSAARLQWGRDLSVAEWQVAGPNAARARASMGPRPFGRGMSSLRCPSLPHMSRFNGAATFRSRNGCG